MATDGQRLLPISEQDARALDAQRAIIEKSFTDAISRSKFRTPAVKLGTLRALLDQEVFKPNQTYELQSMGVVFGDVFVQDMGFHWIIVQDECGRDPAIQYKDTSVILYPLTMISRKIERGEQVDIFKLYNRIAAEAEELIRGK